MVEPEHPQEQLPQQPINPGGLGVGSKEDLGANPLPIVFYVKPAVMYPVEKHQLRSIGGSTVFGGILAALAGAFLGVYQTYSSTLESSLRELSVQTISDYRAYIRFSKPLIYVCAGLYLISMLNVWLGIRRIKHSNKLFILSEGRLVPVDRNQIYPPTRWDKLKAKIGKVVDGWVD